MESRSCMCGALIQAGQRFCRRCGKPVAEMAAQAKGMNAWVGGALLGVVIVVVMVGLAEWTKPSSPPAPGPTASPLNPNGGASAPATTTGAGFPPGPPSPPKVGGGLAPAGPVGTAEPPNPPLPRPGAVETPGSQE